MTAANIEAIDLWKMPPEDFNDWRRQNDFPRILEFFQANLGEFQQWQREYSLEGDELIEKGIAVFLLEEADVIDPLHPTDRYLVKYHSDQLGDSSFISSVEFRQGHDLDTFPHDKTIVKSCRQFKPYLRWAQENKIVVHPRAFHGYLGITTVHAPDVPEYCRVFILDNLELLKMGGIDRKESITLGQRKLDFVNLDFLNFKGESWDSYGKNIRFSSARHWNIQSAKLQFFEFSDTTLENLSVVDSSLIRWTFSRCTGRDCRIENSVLGGCWFGHGSFLPRLDNVDLRDSRLVGGYEKRNEFGFHPSTLLPQRMKAAFASRGQHSQAGECFYMEKVVARKHLARETCRFTIEFLAPEGLRRVLSVLWDKRNKKFIATLRLLRMSLNLAFDARVTNRNKYHLRLAVENAAPFVTSMVDAVWWGYGEKPIRIVRVSLLIIAVGAVLIYITHTTHSSVSVVDSLYYSVVSFLTIGDSSFEPTGIARLIVSIEALLGILNLGLFISGFANKAKY